MPRLVARSWNGEIHHSIEYGDRRSLHMGAPLGRVLSDENISDSEVRQGLDALVAAREQVEGYHGA